MNRLQSKNNLVQFFQKSTLRPLPVNERSALFEKFGMKFHPDSSSRAAIHFIEGKELTLEECKRLSQDLVWQLNHQNIDLLLSMQAMDASFIPVLDLTEKKAGGISSSEDSRWRKLTCLDMLKEANKRGLVFQVEFDFELSPAEAQEIQSAMENSHLIGLIYTDGVSIKSKDAHDCLNSALKKCESLQRAVITWKLLPLLIGNSASEIVLMLGNKDIPDFESLSRLLKQGTVRIFDLRTCDVRMQSEIAGLIKQNNTQQPPSSCVHTLKMNRGSEFNLTKEDYRPAMLEKVFAIPHLWRIEMPDVEWLENIHPKVLLTAVYSSALESLVFTQFATLKPFLRYPDSSRMALDDLAGRLNAILQFKRQREHMAFVAVAEKFTPIATFGFGDASDPKSQTASEFLKMSAGCRVEELEKTLVTQLEETSAGSALACVNKTTRQAANGAREAFDAAHRDEVHELAGMNQFERTLSHAKNSVTALWRMWENR